MPYLFESDGEGSLARFPPGQVLRSYAKRFEEEGEEDPLTHFEYFNLCLSAHFLSCGTPVPTDVDNQIRLKLWPAELPLETALEMSERVLVSRFWNFTQVSTRFNTGAKGSPWEGETLSGHLGEWFTLSSGAYCALLQYADPSAAAQRRRLLESIEAEVERHSEIFGSLWRAEDGLGCLKASASIAHNFGDLDRVMDMWNLDFGDPLRLRFYKLAVTPFDPDRKLRHHGRLWVAGELYKSPIDGSAMALENHRHFALRKPRSLRASREFLIPTGPFFDDWGLRVARGLADPGGAPTEATLEVVEALAHGWNRLPQPVGYGRALRAILEVHPNLNPGDLSRIRCAPAVLATSCSEFEKKWADEALKHMDDIPSRA